MRSSASRRATSASSCTAPARASARILNATSRSASAREEPRSPWHELTPQRSNAGAPFPKMELRLAGAGSLTLPAPAARGFTVFLVYRGLVTVLPSAVG